MQRLMRLAQKTGSPVIVTDVNGAEPTVLMPLETYETMIDGVMMGEESAFEEDFDECEDFEEEPSFDVPLQKMDQDLPFPGEELAAPEVTLEEVPFDPPIPEPKQQAPQSADNLGEEQFYLEPIE